MIDSRINYQFPLRSRLNQKAEFTRVFAEPKVSVDRYFRVLAKNNESQASRLGLAVSRRIDKKAVGRNRLKRIIRESFRLHQNEINAVASLDIVVLPKVGSASICNETLRRSLEQHWRKICSRITKENRASH